MKLTTSCLCLLMSISLCSAAFSQKAYTIKGNISGVPDGTIISLMLNEGNLLSTIATDTMVNGQFNFSGETEQLASLALTGRSPGFPSQWLDVFVEPGSRVEITGTGKLLKTWDVVSEVREQKDLAQFTQASKNQFIQMQELSVQEQTLFAQYEGADSFKRKALKQSIDSLRNLQDALRGIISGNELALLKTNRRRGLVWTETLKRLAQTSKYSTLKSQVVGLYHTVNPEDIDSHSYNEIRNYLFPPVVVKKGERIADTLLLDITGGTHRLADYKGKYLVIDFWSIGCGPCIEAMPELRRISQNMQDKITVISFSLDIKPETWKKASDHLKLEWTNLSDGKGMTGLAAKYGVSGIPHYLIISPEGILLESWVGYSDGLLERQIDRTLKKHSTEKVTPTIGKL